MKSKKPDPLADALDQFYAAAFAAGQRDAVKCMMREINQLRREKGVWPVSYGRM